MRIHGELLPLALLFLLEAASFGDGGSQIRFLPGFEGPLPFYLETGYIGVGEEEKVQLFYYFCKSSGAEPEKDPLMLWLTGGPGCSVLSAVLYENGPLFFNLSTRNAGGYPGFGLNPYSWTQEVNILFLDSPVGTGFSYGKTDEATNATHLQSCEQAYVFLQKWLLDHAEFASSPFYVAGDSFSGATVPVIARMVADGNDLGIAPKFNLKGYVLGDPVTFNEQLNYRIPFAFGMGLISPELYQSLEHNCNGEYYTEDAMNKPCLDDLNTFHELVDLLNIDNVFEATCPSASMRRDMSEVHDDEKNWEIRCRRDTYKFCVSWANDPSVRKSLHIQKGSRETWMKCNTNINVTADFPNMIPYHRNLTSRGYRSLIYSGNFDLKIPTLSTLAWISSLNSPVVENWRPWFVDGQISGYTRSYANKMTYATVLVAGHIPPENRPKETHVMFKRWISDSPL